jgi:hypothetical protein
MQWNWNDRIDCPQRRVIAAALEPQLAERPRQPRSRRLLDPDTGRGEVPFIPSQPQYAIERVPSAATKRAVSINRRQRARGGGATSTDMLTGSLA